MNISDRLEDILENLNVIKHPIKWLEKEAQRKGENLNGIMAISLSEDPSFLKGLVDKPIDQVRELICDLYLEDRMIPDQGPWRVVDWEEKGIVLCSDDFEHDVCLNVSGDFTDKKEKMKYAAELANQLNWNCKSLNWREK
jgi:hypothetical protein